MPIDVGKDQRDYFTLRIPKPRNIERFVYILIIIALLFILFVHNPFPKITCKGFSNDVTGAVVGKDNNIVDLGSGDNGADDLGDDAGGTDDSGSDGGGDDLGGDTSGADEGGSGDGTGDDLGDDTETADGDTSEDDEPQMTALAGEIKYTLGDVGTEIKKAGTPSEYGKVISVNYKIENNKEALENLIIKVYCYDDKSGSLVDEERKVVTTGAFEKGEIKEGKIEFSAMFEDRNTEKTVKVKFYDRDKYLKTLEKKVTIK